MTERNHKPTLMGLPPPEDPFPLTPYRDVHVYTPSHARALRERGEPTPVYIPQPRRFTAEEIDLRRALHRPARLDDTRLQMMRPDEDSSALEGWLAALACLIICSLLLAGALFL